MLSDTLSKLRQIWKSMADRKYRVAYVRANIRNGIAAQIYSMRERSKITQKELASKCEMRQARISVLENASIDNVTVDTLARIAEAFDVGLAVRFVPYSDVARWAADVDEKKLTPDRYYDDSYFKSQRPRLQAFFDDLLMSTSPRFPTHRWSGVSVSMALEDIVAQSMKEKKILSVPGFSGPDFIFCNSNKSQTPSVPLAPSFSEWNKSKLPNPTVPKQNLYRVN